MTAPKKGTDQERALFATKEIIRELKCIKYDPETDLIYWSNSIVSMSVPERIEMLEKAAENLAS